MTAAPTPKELAVILRSLATVLDAPSNVTGKTNGDRAVEMAPLLAQRGWPASTIGSGSRGTAELTSVEAAVDRPNLDWDRVDEKLAVAFHDVWVRALDVRTLVANIVSHAGPDDRRSNQQPGSGDCLVCERYVAGTAVDRLRAGYCDACRKAWERGGRGDRALFARRRRLELDQPKEEVG